MNVPVEKVPVVNAEVPVESESVDFSSAPDEALTEVIADPIMGTVKQPKRMKYTGKKK